MSRKIANGLFLFLLIFSVKPRTFSHLLTQRILNIISLFIKKIICIDSTLHKVVVSVGFQTN